MQVCKKPSYSRTYKMAKDMFIMLKCHLPVCDTYCVTGDGASTCWAIKKFLGQEIVTTACALWIEVKSSNLNLAWDEYRLIKTLLARKNLFQTFFGFTTRYLLLWSFLFWTWPRSNHIKLYWTWTKSAAVQIGLCRMVYLYFLWEFW